MNINIREYLDHEEIKEIVADEIRKMIRDKSDFERILSNTGYAVVWDAVDKLYDGKAKKRVAEKTKEVIEELSTFNVFYKGYDRNEESLGYTIMQQAIRDSEPRIKEIIAQLVEEKDFETEIRNGLEYFADVLIDRLAEK